MLLPGGQVNTDGNVAHWLGLGWAGRLGDAPRPDDGPREVGFASGAAMVVRRAAWDAAGGFDPDYFMYGEDLDLCLRLRLAGCGVGIVPAARSSSTTTRSPRATTSGSTSSATAGGRCSSVYPGPLLLARRCPALLALELALLVAAARGGWLRAKLRAQAAVLRALPASCAGGAGCRRRRRSAPRSSAAARRRPWTPPTSGCRPPQGCYRPGSGRSSGRLDAMTDADRGGRGALLQQGAQVVRLAGGLLVLTIVARSFTLSQLGTYTLLVSLIAYVQFVKASVMTTSGHRRRRGPGRPGRWDEIVSTGIVVYAALGRVGGPS